MREKLYRRRIERPQPGRDDKILTDWNGATICGLVRAAEILDRPDWLAMADTAYRFVKTELVTGETLFHAWFDGRPTAAGLATDYAWMTAAALALHAATCDPARLAEAVAWHDALLHRFYDPEQGACHLTGREAGLIIRPLSIVDDAMPSATGLLTQQVTVLFHLTGNPDYLRTADQIAGKRAGQIAENIIGTASIQAGLDSRQRARLAIVTGANGDALKKPVLAEADPALLLIAPPDLSRLPAGHPARRMTASESVSALYLCDMSSCQPPLGSPAAAADLLARSRTGRPVSYSR